MQKLYSFLFLLISISLTAQIKVRVYDSRDEFRIAKAKISDKNFSVLGFTNDIGELTLNDSITEFNVESEGFQPQNLKVNNQKLVEVFLEQSTISLSAAEFYSNDSIARSYVKKVIRHQSKNSLKKSDSYFFQSYTKFWSTVEQDSLRLILNPKDKKDSSINNWRKFLNESHVFLSERAMDHKYSRSFGSKNIIKSSRISGLKTPIYELDAMQPVLINLDQPRFDFFFRGIENPISSEGLNYYRYKIVEEFQLNGRTTTIVGFTPRQRINKRQLRGEFWIDEKTKALVKIIAENTDDQFYADFDAEWQFIDNNWFPSYQIYRMESGYLNMDGIKIESNEEVDESEKLWIFHQVNFKNIQTPVQYKASEFAGYSTEAAFDVNTVDKTEKVLKEYRGEFSEKDNMTYVKMDSISEKYNIEGKMKLLRIIQKGGKVDIGKVDLDLTKVLSYNNFEGLRLGAAFNTNEKLSTNYSINAYTAYGFKDETFKFGFGGDYFVNKAYSGRIFGNYAQDVSASGHIPMLLQSNFTRFVNGTLKNLYNDQYYSYKKYSAGYEQDIFRNVTFNVSMNYEKQKNEFVYQYEDNQGWLDFYNTQFAVRWAPKDEYLRTPYGKVTVKQGQSVFYILANKYWKFGDSEFDAIRLNVAYSDIFESSLGKSKVNVSTGAVFGEMALMNLFEGMGNAKGKPVFQNFGVATANNFETMLPGEFYSDRYISFQIKHIFAGVRIGQNVILPQFVYRGILGTMNHKQNHNLFDFKTPNHYFHETGVEVNNIFLKNFGLGVYYRLGAYSHSKVEDNIHVKLTFNLNLF
ncbi:DUF5686 family protein [Faecalibacter macacae]|uniref:Carboxypeptidase-like regulatory domain-containing protein n=1 Tax=Faecalibacter macacae TaxID=1859289 RepID=A0A3L9MJP7_9FLAO|nr:DUF5686 family protein [Faecalibacter macacae]RLZ11514.1 hypothetical protein EAH69_05595 [Faecalibacter macacae]